MQRLNIEDDGLSDEYDFMDDVANGAASRRAGGKNTKFKYMQKLRDIAERRVDHILIELDDLQEVKKIPAFIWGFVD